MENTSHNSSRSQSGSQNPRVARRNTRVPRAGPYPTHLTLPGMAARLNRHEQQLRGMDIELQEARENWSLVVMGQISQVSEDHEDTVVSMNVLRDRVVETATDVELLQRRVEQCEQRLQESEEYSRMLVQRLVQAEDNARQTSRLAVTVDRLVTLMEEINLH